MGPSPAECILEGLQRITREEESPFRKTCARSWRDTSMVYHRGSPESLLLDTISASSGPDRESRGRRLESYQRRHLGGESCLDQRRNLDPETNVFSHCRTRLGFQPKPPRTVYKPWGSTPHASFFIQTIALGRACLPCPSPSSQSTEQRAWSTARSTSESTRLGIPTTHTLGLGI